MIEAMACGTPVIAWRLRLGAGGHRGRRHRLHRRLRGRGGRRGAPGRRARPRARSARASSERFSAHGMARDYVDALRAAARPSRRGRRRRALAAERGDAWTTSRRRRRAPADSASRRASRSATALRAEGRRHLPRRRRLWRHRGRRRRPVPRRHADPVALPAAARRRSRRRCSARRSARTTSSSPRNLTNRPLPPLGGPATPQGVIHIERTRFLWDDRLYERICARQLQRRDAAIVPLRLEFAADFRDMFEVRGIDAPRARRAAAAPRSAADTVAASATTGWTASRAPASSPSREPPRPADGRPRPSSCSRCAPAARDGALHRGRRRAGADAVAASASAPPPPGRAATCARAAAAAPRVRSSGRLFNDWIEQVARRPGAADHRAADRALSLCRHPLVLDAVRPRRDHHRAADAVARPGAGARRAALPRRAPGARRRRRSATRRPARSCTRPARARWRRCGELPFGRYYGGVDTTPLFVMLAGAYAERTGDMALHRRAVAGAARGRPAGSSDVGDANGDGFLDYARGATSGLANQGWKDSEDSVFHADGRIPDGPDRAGRGAGLRLRRLRGRWRSSRAGAASRGRARTGARGPSACARRSKQRFWMEEHGFYGIALDGDGELCRVRASNRRAPAVRRPAVAPSGRARVADAAAVAGLRLAAGACARWPRASRASTRCPTTTARSGRTTPRCAPPGIARYGERDGVVRLMRGDVRDRRRTSTCACRSCSAASRARRRAAGRLSRRLPAAGLGGGLGVHDAAGLPGPDASTAGAARSTSTGRACRSASTGSRSRRLGGRRRARST